MKEVSIERLEEIASEVIETIDARDAFEFLNPRDDENYANLDNLLYNVLLNVQQYETIELSTYLRSSFNRRNKLSFWFPLLDASIQQSRSRDEPKDSRQEIFFGLTDELN